MNNLLTAFAVLFAVGIGLPVVSLAVEALRPSPSPPKHLRWAPDIPIRCAKVNGFRLRYIKTGQGPVLVLLHTLRTQLDLFAKVVPGLAEDFSVYALDLPGHGYSDIPDATYDAAFFADTVEHFLKSLDLHDVTLAGVSIGGAIPLIIAARHNPRVRLAVAINPYDYAQGRGMARSSWQAKLVVAAVDIAIVGETVMRLRNFLIMKNILEGGVANPRNIPPPLLKELYLAGNRKGHYQAFISLIRNAESWQAASEHYPQIKIPVLFVWGDRDWARADEKLHDQMLVPGSETVTVENAGHFLPLDKPYELIQQLRDFYRRHAGT